jgi:hypothetical protein
VELVEDGSQGGKGLLAGGRTTRAVSIVKQNDSARSKQALHACHDLLDTRGSSVKHTAVPATDLVAVASRDADQPRTAHAVRSAKERCRRLPEGFLDGPRSGSELLAKGAGWTESQQAVGVAVACDLVTVGCEPCHDVRIGPYMSSQDEERRAVAPLRQQRADRGRVPRIGAVVEGERKLRPIRACAYNAAEQTGVLRERSVQVCDPDHERESEKETAAA